jgi:hypothetical protein
VSKSIFVEMVVIGGDDEWKIEAGQTAQRRGGMPAVVNRGGYLVDQLPA